MNAILQNKCTHNNGGQTEAILKPIKHYNSMVSRGFKEALNWAPIMFWIAEVLSPSRMTRSYSYINIYKYMNITNAFCLTKKYVRDLQATR